jgi:hypothetical protein
MSFKTSVGTFAFPIIYTQPKMFQVGFLFNFNFHSNIRTLNVALRRSTWGLVMAMARITETGWMSYPEVLVMAPYYLGSLAIVALLFFFGGKKKHQEN